MGEAMCPKTPPEYRQAKADRETCRRLARAEKLARKHARKKKRDSHETP